MEILVLRVSKVVKVHQTTVDAYLEDIVSSAIDQTAIAQARQEIQQMAAIINDAAYDAEQRSFLLLQLLQTWPVTVCLLVTAIIVRVCCIL